jgi:phage terminase small subunit
MPCRITESDLTGLKSKYINFVIEYCKDFNARRAAQASGFEPDSGYGILKVDEVEKAIQRVLMSRLDASHIDAEWVLMEAVDNHLIARQTGNITASNTALNLVAKHTFVDALAAEKVEVSSDHEIMERLLRGRKRLNKGDKKDDDTVSFL